ncbi:MAG: DUF4349 domain-containing protein [Myxococcota bacterium]
MIGLVALAWAEAVAVQGALTVQVYDREAATKQVIADAKAAKGWFSALDDDGVTVQVPREAAKDLMEKERALGRVVARSWESDSLEAQRTALLARIATREQVLAQLMKVLETAESDSVTSVRHEISRAITELERYKGQLRQIEHRGTYATLRFSWQFRDRSAPKRDGSSSFAWLNTMNVGDLQEAFRSGDLTHDSRGVEATAPDGFAPYPKARRFAATSPDGVVYRVRTAKNEPEADLAFWREALTTRMKEAGYTVVSEGELDGGAYLELSAANGPRDDAYLIGIFVAGRKIVIAEAAGEVTRFAARRDAVLAAMKGIERQ